MVDSRAGLADVRCDPIEIPTTFESFDTFWRPFLGGTGPAPAYVATLSEAQRGKLATALDRALTRRADGAIALTARAWAVRGVTRAA